jgi:ParB-like chromosome segregation protein Spo0J
MEVVEIPVEWIHPNGWNVNRMAPAMRKKLAAYLKREGLVEPLVVRPHPGRKGEYELLGGEHRWRICREELGYDKIPCVILEGLDDKRAKILSINLNSMSGDSVPSLLSKLLSDLHQEMPLPDLEATLPYDAREIQDALSLMQLPEGLAEEVEDEADAMDEESPVVVTVVLDKTQAATFDEALGKASDEIGKAKDFKARAVTKMAEAYLGKGSSPRARCAANGEG